MYKRVRSIEIELAKVAGTGTLDGDGTSTASGALDLASHVMDDGVAALFLVRPLLLAVVQRHAEQLHRVPVIFPRRRGVRSVKVQLQQPA
jgi:hypothetical protein